ncbi:filamentous hemagglutinin N-terminal domain-containing protein [Candidatus Halobeggiatoa sp. HSG11]|nr:filamentous hemagglutinin N-terminal domain-containing protein [Candidatus Halobeggiatoa sp. HSG11]
MFKKILIILLLICHSINAEIITDGTLGQQINLPGSNFQITSDQGQQHGGNLFHSFQDFNLNSSESATFSGPNSVQNIISRVTGGNPSNIDGLIRSTIPNADMYFLNPYGIIFGPNAKLNMQGSFHASTADYLKLGDNGRFDARHLNDSILTVAPVESFGFLTNTPADIKLLDSHLVLPGAISLIGGDIEINANEDLNYFNSLTQGEIFYNSIFQPKIEIFQMASIKQINLISVAELGEITLDTFNLQAGQITMNRSYIGVFNQGEIFIRAAELKLIDSFIDTLSFKGSGLIDISVNNLELQGNEIFAGIRSNILSFGKGSTINIQTNDLTINKGWIYNATFGIGDGGDTFITASNNLTISGQHTTSKLGIPSGILGLTFTKENAGNVGNINIQAGQISLTKGAQILNQTFGAGDSGTINIYVDGSITVSGEDIDGMTSSIAGESGDNDIANLGNAADINIEAQQITLANGAEIASDTFGFGNGGNIKIRLTDSLTVHGQGSTGIPSAVSASSTHNGDAGNIDIIAKQINLTAGGAIYGATLSSGNAGSIDILAEQIFAQGGFDKPWGEVISYNNNIRFLPSGIFTTSGGQTFATGNAGPIKIRANQIKLLNGGEINSGTHGGGNGNSIELTVTDNITIDGEYIREELSFPSGILSNSMAPESYAGNAGNLILNADRILLSNNGAIITNALNASGGNINLDTNNLLYLRETDITTSVNGGDGNGGNINIGISKFVVLDNSRITAQAYAGLGGNINIDAERFIKTPDSVVSASSKLGLDGEITINSPDVDMEGFLVVLPDKVVDASNLMKTPCGQRIAENMSSFVVIPSEGAYNSPDDLIPSGPLLLENLPNKNN